MKLWKRAGLLWFLCVVFTLVYTVWALHYPESEKYATLYSREGLSFLYNTFLLRFSFGWADFLSRYAWFMFFAPFALWFIAKRMWWLVATGSIALWALFRHTEMLLPFSAWQIVFVAGIIIGYYFPIITRWVSQLPKQVKFIASGSIISISIITFILSILHYVVLPAYPDLASAPLMQAAVMFADSISGSIDKASLDIGRLVIGSIWFAALFIIFRRFETSIDKGTGSTLQLLGKNSLFVYSLHAFVLFVIDMYLRPPGGSEKFLLNTILVIIVVCIIYFVTRFKNRLLTPLSRAWNKIKRA